MGLLLDAELPRLGELVGAFRLTEQIGSGGTAMVYRARREADGVDVAIKVVLPQVAASVPGVLERFRREADLIRRLDHPNVVRFFGTGETGTGLPWMAMELLDGAEVEAIIREQGALAAPRALRFGCEVLSALAEAHRRGFVHRDLKPSNVMVTTDASGQEVAKVVDFGIGKDLRDGGDMGQITSVFGDAGSTPRYTAPELMKGQKLGPAADVYAVGLILFEMLTGSPAVKGNSLFELLAWHATGELVLPDWIASSPLGPVMRRATERDPAARYPDAGAFLEALSQVAPGALKQPSNYRATAPAPAPQPAPEAGAGGVFVSRLDAFFGASPAPAAPRGPAPSVPSRFDFSRAAESDDEKPTVIASSIEGMPLPMPSKKEIRSAVPDFARSPVDTFDDLPVPQIPSGAFDTMDEPAIDLASFDESSDPTPDSPIDTFDDIDPLSAPSDVVSLDADERGAPADPPTEESDVVDAFDFAPTAVIDRPDFAAFLQRAPAPVPVEAAQPSAKQDPIAAEPEPEPVPEAVPAAAASADAAQRRGLLLLVVAVLFTMLALALALFLG